MSNLKLDIRGRVAEVCLQRGNGINALDLQTLEELRDTARHLADIDDLAAVVLRGDPVFSAGADLGDPEMAKLRQQSKLEQRQRLKLGPDMCQAWEDIEAYTIAAIEGYCVGGGSALALALDYRIAAESAFFRLPEVPLGMNMSWRSLPRLVAQIGPARTKQYVLFGDKVPAATALQWGLCEEVVADGGTLEAARKLAERAAALPPLPARMTKSAVNAHANALAFASAQMDRDQFLLTSQTEDLAEAVAAFMQKREPTFRGN